IGAILLLVVGEKERRSHVAFICLTPRVLAEGVVETAEVWKIGHIRDQALYTSVKGRFLVGIHGELAIQFARHVSEDLYKIGDITASVIDVGLEQDAVTRGLVQLD